MRPRAMLAALLCSALLAAAPVRAEFLTNGGFEAGAAISPTIPVLAVAPGGTSLTGWTVVNGAVSIVTSDYWVPIAGTRSVALSSTGPGAIQQSFPSTPGANYRLTFWIAGEPFSTPTIKHLRVTAGPAQADYTFDIAPAWNWDMFWTQHTLDFTANASTTTVRFASQDDTQWGPAIDEASLVLTSLGVPPSSPLSLSAVSPDPTQGRARVAFSLASAGHARLSLYDVQGRERARLVDGALGAGPHAASFDAAEWGAAPGLYLAVLETAGQRLVSRFTVLH